MSSKSPASIAFKSEMEKYFIVAASSPNYTCLKCECLIQSDRALIHLKVQHQDVYPQVYDLWKKAVEEKIP